MTRQYKMHQASQAFDRNASRLRLELSMGTPRRHLDVLVELLETLLPETGGSLVTEHYKQMLAQLKADVASRSNLRLVK
jgi:hypothetical protein